MGDDIASGALKDMHMLAHAKKAAISVQIKATQHTMDAFDAKFDEAFNQGWKDAGRKAREVGFGVALACTHLCFHRSRAVCVCCSM